MDDDQIEALKDAAARGLPVFWKNVDGVFMRIEKVGSHFDEPGPVAYFQDGTYAALYNAQYDSFFVAHRLFGE